MLKISLGGRVLFQEFVQLHLHTTRFPQNNKKK